ncbi:MAG: caspase family protein, partial [Bacteroidales bacterium]|nr:caspase family protein [Bacteroidales bacterium]
IDITVLLNDEATKINIVKALSTLCDNAKAGDYIYIHFSCHGQQMIDDNGDEPDGLDEALIPYDAPRRYSKGTYEGENHLRDDLLGEFLNKIRAKTGREGNVTVVLDACHSGTGDRDVDDEQYARGTSYIFAPEGYQIKVPNNETGSLQLQDGKHLAPITVFAACKPDEINYEYKSKIDSIYYGSLSYAFCNVLKTSTGKSNAEFYKLLNNEMQTMFVGRRRKQSPYFESTNESKTFRISR